MKMSDKEIKEHIKTAGAVFITDGSGEIVDCGMIEFNRNDEAGIYETDVRIINDHEKPKFIRTMYVERFPAILGGRFGGWRAIAVVSPSFEIPPYIVIHALHALAIRYAKKAESSEQTIAVKPSKVAS